LVVANKRSNTVSVLLGNGNGTFQAAQNFRVGSYPTSVAVADVNGDGRLDVVTANFHSNSLSVLVGNGNGTFLTARTVRLGSSPAAVAVADVNGDGRLDLVVADYASNGVSVLLGNGNGTFKSAVNFGVGLGPFSVAVADVNRDGLPDLVVANDSGNSVSVLLGNRNAATHFRVTAPANVTLGTPFNVTITALTAGNQLDALYTGTIHFTSSDGSAVLPADFTFTLADSGSHTFSVTINTAGSQTITVTDTTTGITGSAVVNGSAARPAPALAGKSDPGGSPMAAVTAAAPGLFLIRAMPSATSGTPIRIPVDALDLFGSMIPGDWGAPTLGGSGGTVGLPGSYTLVTTEEDRHSFAVADTAPLSQGTATVALNAVRWWGERGRQTLASDVDGLTPRGVDAFFGQNESSG
jgi:hypothetical protein